MGRKRKSRMVDISTSHSVQNMASDVETQGSVCDSPENNAVDEGTSTKTQRGPTLMAHIWNQPTEKRIVVEWNKRWQPIGDEASDLAFFLGTVARNPMLCSLSYHDWRLFSKEGKKDLLEIVKAKFIISHKRAENYVLSSIGRKWSNYKCELKSEHYEPHFGSASATTIINNHRPDCVPRDQWISLVTRWSSTQGKRRIDKNTESRSKQVMMHTAGCKSFARVSAELAIDGVEPSRAHVYLNTHKDRKIRPAPMDDKSKEATELINEKLSQLPNGKEVVEDNVAWEGDIYSQAMKEINVGEERRGRVRGIGFGPPSLASLSSSVSSSQLGGRSEDTHDSCNGRMDCLEAQNRELKDHNKKLEDKVMHLESELTKIRAIVVTRRAMEDSQA